MRGDDVVAADALDPFQFVLGGEVPHGDDLHVLFPSVRDVQEHVPEVADAPGVLYGVLDRVLLRLFKLRARRVEDIPDMRAVLVVTPSEKGSVLVEQHGLDRAEVAGQAVDCLAHVIVFQVQHLARPELVELPGREQEPVSVRLLHPAHVDRGQVPHPCHFPEPVPRKEQIGVGEDHIVRGHGVHVPAREGGGRPEPAHGHVRFELKDRPVVGVARKSRASPDHGTGVA